MTTEKPSETPPAGYRAMIEAMQPLRHEIPQQVAHELQALRQEVVALRDEVTSRRGAIIVGPEMRSAYAELLRRKGSAP